MLRKLIDSPWLYFVLAALLLVITVMSQFRSVSNDAPRGSIQDLETLRDRSDVNVLFILIDTLRSDRLSAWGYERKTSPNLDALAARGIRFARVESQSSWTKASMASLWTGMYPERTGVLGFANALPDVAVLPAEIFSEAGYRTAGVWRNGWVANNFGFDQGFDLYLRPATNRPISNVQRHNPSTHGVIGTDADATESAMEFVIGVGEAPFFLYVHYMDVHQYLYADTSPDWGADFSDIYDSAIHWTDRNVGMLVDLLRDQGLLDKTMIVIASDHGEAFFEHGGEGHARNLYREVQEVPLIIVPPFALEPGIVVQERVANVDIWPTVLDMLGLSAIPGAEGRSVLPLILAAGGAGGVPDGFEGRPIFSQLDSDWGKKNIEPSPMVAMVKDQYRLIYQEKSSDPLELYDHSSDPTEQTNIAMSNAELSGELKAEIDAFLAIPRTQWQEAPEIEVDEMRRAQLRALGYVIPASDRRRNQRKKAQEQPGGPEVDAEPGAAE